MFVEFIRRGHYFLHAQKRAYKLFQLEVGYRKNWSKAQAVAFDNECGKRQVIESFSIFYRFYTQRY